MTLRRRASGGRAPSRAATRLVPILALLLLVPTLPAPTLAAAGDVTRQWGANRFGTAAEISEATFAPGVDAVYIVNGMGFPDALGAAPAAAHRGGPTLLVTQNSIPAETHAELVRLQPDQIIVAGGTAVVSQAVQNALTGPAYGSPAVSRQWGANRFGTAAEISKATFAPGVDAAYIVNGMGYPDALGAGPAAAHHGGPTLLVTQNSIPAETRAELLRLLPDQIIVAGGTGVVSLAVENALEALFVGENVSRQWGANRFGTAAEISEATFAPGVNAAYIVNGMGYPDALGAGPAAAHRGGPVLLVTQCSIPVETKAELLRLSPDQIIIAGGTGVVCADLESQLQTLLPCVGSPPDTDGDGINDTTDAFACDPTNASGRSVPFTMNFNGGDGGLENAGFTGLMTNGSTPSLSLFDPADVNVTGGRLVISDIPDGDAQNGSNTLQNGFQVNVTTPVSSFTVHARVCEPSSFPSAEFASVGMFFGPGNQDNYIKLTLKGDEGMHAVHDAREVSAVGVGIATHKDADIATLGAGQCIDLYLKVNTSTLKYSPSYKLPGDTTGRGLGGDNNQRTVPASWIDGTQPMAVGIWVTSAGPAPTFTASYELLEVTAGSQ